MSRAYLVTVLLCGTAVLAAPPATSSQKVDECWLDTDACYRRAVELRQARERCEGGRLVIDETAFSSGQHRVQGAACLSFHSSPVAWEWVAATSGELITAKDDWKYRRTDRNIVWDRWLERPRAFDFDGDAGPFSQLVRTSLRPARSRLAGATLVVRGDTLWAVEVHPAADDLRAVDLPWGLQPWRPMWFFLPKLDEAEHALLAKARLIHLVRTERGKCLINELEGERLLTEGPAAQDATATETPCDEVMERLAAEPSLQKVSRYLTELLASPPRRPAFDRPVTPNVETFTPDRVAIPLR